MLFPVILVNPLVKQASLPTGFFNYLLSDMYIFASIGLITEPCAEPSSVGSNFPCSIIPALRYLRISHNKFLSCIFHSRNFIIQSWSIWSKKSLISVSTIYCIIIFWSFLSYNQNRYLHSFKFFYNYRKWQIYYLPLNFCGSDNDNIRDFFIKIALFVKSVYDKSGIKTQIKNIL